MTDPKALAVLADALREALGEKDAADVLRWAQHPEAVRELLRYDPVREEYDQEACAACSEVAGDYPTATAHLGACTVAAAWRALGDPRGAADIERAHEEALRDRRQLPRAVTHGEWGGWLPGGAPLNPEEVMVRLSPGHAFASGLLAYTFDPARGSMPFGQAPRDVSAGERFEVTNGYLTVECEAGENISAGAMLDAMYVPAVRAEDAPAPDRWILSPAAMAVATQRAAHITERNRSDARGMEAVEAEAWREEMRVRDVVSTREHWPDGSPRPAPCDCAACEAGQPDNSFAGHQHRHALRQHSDARGLDFVEDEARAEDLHQDRLASDEEHAAQWSGYLEAD